MGDGVRMPELTFFFNVDPFLSKYGQLLVDFHWTGRREDARQNLSSSPRIFQAANWKFPRDCKKIAAPGKSDPPLHIPPVRLMCANFAKMIVSSRFNDFTQRVQRLLRAVHWRPPLQGARRDATGDR